MRHADVRHDGTARQQRKQVTPLGDELGTRGEPQYSSMAVASRSTWRRGRGGNAGGRGACVEGGDGWLSGGRGSGSSGSGCGSIGIDGVGGSSRGEGGAGDAAVTTQALSSGAHWGWAAAVVRLGVSLHSCVCARLLHR